MAKIVKLASLRIGETFVIFPNDAKSILTEGVTIYNFQFPSEYYIFSSQDSLANTCQVYLSSATYTPCYLPSDILVIKF